MGGKKPKSGAEVAKMMMKSDTMKGFANKVKKMKTVTAVQLDKMLPDYVSGGDIHAMFEEITEGKLGDSIIRKDFPNVWAASAKDRTILKKFHAKVDTSNYKKQKEIYKKNIKAFMSGLGKEKLSTIMKKMTVKKGPMKGWMTDSVIHGVAQDVEELQESKMGDLLIDIQMGATAKELARDHEITIQMAKNFLADYYGSRKPRKAPGLKKEQVHSEDTEETKLTEAMSKQMTLKQYANKIGIDAKEKQWIMDNEPDMVAYFPNDKLKGSWNALSYPVRTGDYYFAFLTGDDDKRKKAASDANMKMNDLLKSELATAKKLKFDGEPYTEDMIASYLWNKVYAAFEKLPRNLGPGDTMTREELYRAINDITGGEVQFESFDYQGETIQEGMVSGMLGKILNKVRNARKKIGKKIKLGRKAKIGKVHEDVMNTYRLMSEAQPIGSVGIRQDHQSDSNRDARVADWKKKKSEETKVEALQKKLEFARKQRQRHDDAAEEYRERASKVRERNPDDRAADGYDNKADRQEEMADNQNNKVQDIKDEIRKAKGIKEEQVKPFFDTYKDMMQEEVANITVDKQNKISKSSDQNAKALLVHDAAKRMGLKVSMVGKHVRVKGTKKKIQDFMMVVIGKSSYGDPTEQDTSTPQIDKMLNKSLK